MPLATAVCRDAHYNGRRECGEWARETISRRRHRKRVNTTLAEASHGCDRVELSLIRGPNAASAIASVLAN
jgi:hypothetical protein